MGRGIVLKLRKLFIYTHELFIGARDLLISMSEPFIRARDQDIVGFNCFRVRRGIHWRSFSGPMSPEVSGRISTRSTNRQALNAVLTKAWPYDGKYRAAYGESPLGTRFGLVAGAESARRHWAARFFPRTYRLGSGSVRVGKRVRYLFRTSPVNKHIGSISEFQK